MTADWIAVDWGTSNVRVWGIDADGAVNFSRASDQGMGKITRADYPRVLTELLGESAGSTREPLDVLICGMAGARQGWLEAPYIETPARLDRLAASAVRPAMPGLHVAPRILPGVCQRGEREDVIRGEETQILGLISQSPGLEGVVCMPGTHVKWVDVRDGRIVRFASAMTGELFDVLRTHSVLRHSLGGEADPVERDAGLREGLASGVAAPEKLTATLFRVRASALLSGRTPSWCEGFLSGLLIGADIGGQRDWIGGAEIPIVGGAALAPVYAEGLKLVGATTRLVNAGEAALAGLRAARMEKS